MSKVRLALICLSAVALGCVAGFLAGQEQGERHAFDHARHVACRDPRTTNFLAQMLRPGGHLDPEMTGPSRPPKQELGEDTI
jgi:hypothetical protein